MANCPFCEIIAGRAAANVVQSWDDGTIAIVPLDPVVEGHLLVIPALHLMDALAHPAITAGVMCHAAEIATPPCNIITSVGAAATQSVYHLHVHVVPRAPDDGLMLPWGSNEAHVRRHQENAYAFSALDKPAS